MKGIAILWRAIQLAEGTTLALRTDGRDGQPMHIESNGAETRG
jgi:hypothetical protein